MTEIERYTITGITNSDEDYNAIREVLYTSVIDSVTGQPVKQEIFDILEKINDTINSADLDYRYYAVREPMGNKIVGIVGLRPPEERLKEQIDTTRTDIELINFFILPNYRGKGLGKRFLNQLKINAKKLGFKRIVWSSGKRYEKTAWAFYDREAGQAIKEVPNFFGADTFAKIWEINL